MEIGIIVPRNDYEDGRAIKKEAIKASITFTLFLLEQICCLILDKPTKIVFIDLNNFLLSS